MFFVLLHSALMVISEVKKNANKASRNISKVSANIRMGSATVSMSKIYINVSLFGALKLHCSSQIGSMHSF